MPEEIKKKRKTHTSTEVKTRYNKKTYKKYDVNFRVVEDAEIIARIEEAKKEGLGTTDAFRKLLDK